MTTKAHPSESGAGGRLGGRAGAPGVQKGAMAMSKPHPQGPLMMVMVPDLAPLGSELLPLLQAAGWRCSVLPEPAWGTEAPPQDARTLPEGLHLERLRGTCAWTQQVPKMCRVIERKSSVNDMSFPLGMSLPRARSHPVSGQWSWHLGAPAGLRHALGLQKLSSQRLGCHAEPVPFGMVPVSYCGGLGPSPTGPLCDSSCLRPHRVHLTLGDSDCGQLGGLG